MKGMAFDQAPIWNLGKLHLSGPCGQTGQHRCFPLTSNPTSNYCSPAHEQEHFHLIPNCGFPRVSELRGVTTEYGVHLESNLPEEAAFSGPLRQMGRHRCQNRWWRFRNPVPSSSARADEASRGQSRPSPLRVDLAGNPPRMHLPHAPAPSIPPFNLDLYVEQGTSLSEKERSGGDGSRGSYEGHVGKGGPWRFSRDFCKSGEQGIWGGGAA